MKNPGPKNLDQLLEAVPGLRRTRSLNADWLRRLLDRQKGECTWCGTKVPKGSRTWCSDDCVSAFRLRCDPQAQAAFVARRDNDTCSICGRVIAEMEREFICAWDERKKMLGLKLGSWQEKEKLRKEYGIGRRNWREVDHIVPVIEGGGLCGPENLRLLCGICHGKETANLRKRISRRK